MVRLLRPLPEAWPLILVAVAGVALIVARGWLAAWYVHRLLISSGSPLPPDQESMYAWYYGALGVLCLVFAGLGYLQT